MKTLYRLVSFAGLALMLVAALLLYAGKLSESSYHTLALVGTLLWFVPVPFWMKRRLHHSE
jgi:hypothetical protein